jgi:transcriptional regulator with PAS, ATPase and Fis domain
MRKIIFILWPEPDCLMSAAVTVKQHGLSKQEYEIAPTGKNTILARLLELSEQYKQASFNEAHIFVPFVKRQEIKKIRAAIKKITEQNSKIYWHTYQKTDDISAICKNLKGVEFCPSSIHVNADGGPLSGKTSKDKTKVVKLNDVLRYKITKAFLGTRDRSFDSSQIKEILEDLSLEKELVAKYNQPVRNFAKNYPAIEGKSKPIINLKKEVHRLAQASDINVLLFGETGTGKEAAAFFLHDLSERRYKPYGALNCANFREELLHSTLFGHKKGSFTGATADKLGLVKSLAGGTIFLDELPDMPISVQAMLLRFLEDGSYIPLGGTQDDEQHADIRVIASAQPELLENKIENNAFRKDLYFRLAEKEIQLPPLREITEDILNLVVHLVYKMDKKNPIKRYETVDFFSSNLTLFTSYSWPGNVRELAGYVKRRLRLGSSEEESIIEDVKGRKSLFGQSPDSTIVQEPQPSVYDAPVFFGDINKDSALDTHKEILEKYIKHVYDQLHSQGVSKREICNKLGIANQVTLNRYLNN